MFFYNEGDSEVSQEQGPAIVTEGLQLHLDAGDANSYSGTGTTWYDLSGNGNNATLVNGVGFDSDSGGSLVFDGINDHADTVPLQYSSYMAFSVWVKVSSTTAVVSSFIDYNTTDNKTIMNLGYRTEQPGNVALTYNDALVQSAAYPYMISDAPFADGAWKNIVGVYDQEGPKIYVNGVRRTAVTHYADSFNVRNSVLTSPSQEHFVRLMGLGNIESGYKLPGKLGAVLAYNKALSEAEVLQNFEATKTRFGL